MRHAEPRAARAARERRRPSGERRGRSPPGAAGGRRLARRAAREDREDYGATGGAAPRPPGPPRGRARRAAGRTPAACGRVEASGADASPRAGPRAAWHRDAAAQNRPASRVTGRRRRRRRAAVPHDPAGLAAGCGAIRPLRLGGAPDARASLARPRGRAGRPLGDRCGGPAPAANRGRPRAAPRAPATFPRTARDVPRSFPRSPAARLIRRRPGRRQR